MPKPRLWGRLRVTLQFLYDHNGYSTEKAMERFGKAPIFELQSREFIEFIGDAIYVTEKTVDLFFA